MDKPAKKKKKKQMCSYNKQWEAVRNLDTVVKMT